MSDKIAVVLLNLGGPDSLDAVEPFLFNLFSDPDIIDFPGSFLFRKRLAKIISTRRAPMVQKQYEKIGGKSPIKEFTLRQAELLEERINERIPAKVLVAMRYWNPSTDDALDAVLAEGIEKIVLLPLYPQFSKATTVSSTKEWEKRTRERGIDGKLDVVRVDDYYTDEKYVEALVERVNEGLERFEPDVRDRVTVVFSAHGTPMKLARSGDPYSDHIKATVAAVMKKGEYTQPHTLCYQSKVGPLKWLEPSTPNTIERLASEGVRHMLIVPIAFTSDHLETLFELNIEYRRVAKEAGVEQYEMTEGLNDSPTFMNALAGLVFDKLGIESDAKGVAA
ncbi:MAG: ferrochelatase [Acidobacteria bacterium]|nr:ferrochelatase [Acidobacteriota bacterium]